MLAESMDSCCKFSMPVGVELWLLLLLLASKAVEELGKIDKQPTAYFLKPGFNSHCKFWFPPKNTCPVIEVFVEPTLFGRSAFCTYHYEMHWWFNVEQETDKIRRILKLDKSLLGCDMDHLNTLGIPWTKQQKWFIPFGNQKLSGRRKRLENISINPGTNEVLEHFFVKDYEKERLGELAEYTWIACRRSADTLLYHKALDKLTNTSDQELIQIGEENFKTRRKPENGFETD
uniref:Uncharacterized protein n=1 Tax=Ditylenchus dipsaci TaxID=166011 RepID=A0A915CQ26_9BILA